MWTSLDTWIVVTGALSAVSCALLGNFLVLRRMSMMGDAISHAVLPGLAIAFLLTGSRDSVTMLIGAGVVGVLTALFTQWIHSFGQVEESSAMGVVFTTLFAGGLVLIVRAADAVDLDPGCVLYGAIELTPLDTITGLGIPRAAISVGAILLVNLLFVVLFFKELRISSFDPALATTLGINARLMHYLLMTLVAVTTVASFESVGSILVIAMFVVPAAAAHLLTDRLATMVVISAILAALASVIGHLGAIHGPGWFGLPGVSSSTAGMMAVAAGLIFLMVLLGAPRHGVVSRMLGRIRLTLRILREDILGLLYRLEEAGAPPTMFAHSTLAEALHAAPLVSRVALWRLQRAGRVQRRPDGFHLTVAGRDAARELVRSHRLWESYLEKHLHVPASHLHAPAAQLEHVTDADLQARLAAQADQPLSDPHGRTIPPATPNP